MTDPLYRDAYLRVATSQTLAVTDQGVVPDATNFYPQGGGQPGDSGQIDWDGGTAPVVNAVKGNDDAIILMLADGSPRPPVGAQITQTLDWDRRLLHMRIHTALHLLSVAVPLPVTGGAITDVKGRLDFNMDTPPEDKQVLADAINAMIDRDLPILEDWITDDELAANPGLVKTMSVKPPMGAGRVRLIRIGEGDAQVDLQPCGGTHVASTGEIGHVRIGKIEKKGRQNRRVNLFLESPA